MITTPLVLQYTVVHGAAFIVFGLAAAGMLALADREPRLLFAFVMLLCCFEVFFAAMVAILAEWLLEAVPWWTILAGNLLAAARDDGLLLPRPPGHLARVHPRRAAGLGSGLEFRHFRTRGATSPASAKMSEFKT